MNVLHEITVTHVAPPVPTRAFDYQAIVSDYEDDSPKGHGATPEQALVDLIGQLSEGADPALTDALVKMFETDAEQAAARGAHPEYIRALRYAAASIAGSMA